MKRFDDDDFENNDDIETTAWETFLADKMFEVKRGEGFYRDGNNIEKINRIVYYMDEDDFPDDETVGECGFNFIAGYETEKDRICDILNIPAEIFEKMFEGILPKSMEIEWNGAEQTHFVEGDSKYSMTVKEAKDIIFPVLEANGFVRVN
jgi:hypothetical protein